MSFLNAVINKVEDEFAKEQFQERVDIVGHKIKFMDQVTVAVLNTDNEADHRLDSLLELAGGKVVQDVAEARVLIYAEAGLSLLDLMGRVPGLIQAEWPAATYNRVYLVDDLKSGLDNPAYSLELLEDLAELLHPGAFIFGNEGKTWMSFGV